MDHMSVLGSNLTVGDAKVCTGTMDVQNMARHEPGNWPSDEQRKLDSTYFQ